MRLTQEQLYSVVNAIATVEKAKLKKIHDAKVKAAMPGINAMARKWYDHFKKMPDNIAQIINNRHTRVSLKTITDGLIGQFTGDAKTVNREEIKTRITLCSIESENMPQLKALLKSRYKYEF